VTEPVLIDGSHGEGGGQVLRTSLALSALTGKPLEIINVRANRSKPGLRPQHMQAVSAAAAVCGAELTGNAIGSTSVSFVPGELRAGSYRFDIGTAGSTSLVLQTIYLPLLLAAKGQSSVTVTGGTHVPFAPCFHYLDQQWRGYLERIGLHVRLELGGAGYYPKGGGRVTATFQPTGRPLGLQVQDRGRLLRIAGISSVSNLPMSIAERQKQRALRRLSTRGCQVDIELAELPGIGKGTMLLLVVQFERSQACYCGLGARGKPAEAVADEAVDRVLRLLDGAGQVDEHLADQIVLPLAVADGPSSFVTPEITAHLLTNIDVIRAFLPAEITVHGDLGCEGRVTVLPGPGWLR